MRALKISGIICLCLLLLLIVLGWLFAIPDICRFSWEGSQQVLKMPKGGIKIPIEYRNHWTFVHGVINGKTPVNLLLDTGTTDLSIDKSLAKEVRILFCPPHKTEYFDETRDLQWAILPELKMGKLVFHSVPVTIEDLNALSCQSGFRIDGILGQMILEHFAISLDKNSHFVTFENPAKVQVSPESHKIPCFMQRIPMVSGVIGTRAKQNFVIDTGAQQNQLPKKIAEQFNLDVSKNGWVSFSGSATGKVRNIGWVKVPQISLDGLKLQDLWFNVDMSGGKAENTASLGYDFLKNFRLTLNPSKSEIFLEDRAITPEAKLEDEARLLIDAGKFTEALTVLTEGIRQHPKNPDLRILLATDYFQFKKYTECVAELTKCIESGRTDADLYFMRAISYHKLGQQNLAEQSVLQFASMFATDPFTQFRCGQILCQISAIPQAIARFSYALKLQPDIAEIYLERAEAYEKLREYKKELDDYDAIVKLSHTKRSIITIVLGFVIKLVILINQLKIATKQLT